MEGFFEQVRNQQSIPQSKHEQRVENNLQPSQTPDLEFFIPPPINYLNSKYHQHFANSQNPFRNFSPNYTCFKEQLPFNTDENSSMFAVQNPEVLKNKLNHYNKEIYVIMLRILAKQGSGQAMNKAECQVLQKQLKEKVRMFKDACLRAKVVQARSQILKNLVEDTTKIVKKTEEIRRQIEQIKLQFEQQSNQIKIIEQFGPQQSAMQIEH